MSDTINIEDLKQDSKNFNKGTYEGETLVRKSIERLKAGRSILIDKDNNIIAGNKTAAAAGSLGLKVKVIETDGTELIAVKRTDLDINSKEGREMALADNRTAQVNLAWDEQNLEEASLQFDIDPSQWGVNFENNAPTAISKGEIDVGTFDTNQTLVVKLTSLQYEAVIDKLKVVNPDLQEALLEILGYYA